MSRLYEDEMATGEFSTFADVSQKIGFRLTGEDDALAQLEFNKAISTVIPQRFVPDAARAWDRGKQRCESPIEKVLLPWLICQRYQFFDYKPTVLLPGETDSYVPGTLAVIPQLPIGRFRADFALAGSLGGPIRFVIIECDGREFHDGVENVKRDLKRDVDILKNKRVLDVRRIDGGTILSNPQGVGQWAARAVLDAWRKK